MNHIEAKLNTSFNREVLNIFIDGISLSDFVSKKAGELTFNDLWCSWLKNDDRESDYMWQLLDSRRDGYIPVLLCPDDFDFWCTVIVADIHHEGDRVLWEWLGVVTGKINITEWRESGIQNIEKWSENDWALYGGTLAVLDVSDKAWEKWWSENWPDEEMRRLWNYFDPYFNDDDNITWINCESISFSATDYEVCIEKFRNFIY